MWYWYIDNVSDPKRRHIRLQRHTDILTLEDWVNSVDGRFKLSNKYGKIPAFFSWEDGLDYIEEAGTESD